MPSEKAVESAYKFLGYDFRADPCRWQARQHLAQADVSNTDDGLRTLAANGSWSEVVSLAAKLEVTTAKNAHHHALLSKEGNPVESAMHTVVLVSRLPYILVQVTAYFKMQRVDEVKKLLDALGDIEGDVFLDPITRENLAPFSLRFLFCLIPFYMSVPMETLKRLYGLLEKCESCVRDSFSLSSPNDGRKWEQRVKRIQRALIYVYYSTGKFELAIRTFQKMIDWEKVLENMGTNTKCWSHSKRIRHVLQLQQFACLCLHCGNAVLSGEAFNIIAMFFSESSPSPAFSDSPSKINNGKISDGRTLEASLYAHIIDMNEGFKLVFSGKFSEAAECFRSIALRVGDDIKDRSCQAAIEPIGEKRPVVDTLTGTVLQQLKTNAQTSHCTSLLYCGHEGKGAEAFMTEIRDILEHYLRGDPNILTQSDAFLSDLVRVYALCGERKEKLEQLAGLLEGFRCDVASLPNLEKMV